MKDGSYYHKITRQNILGEVFSNFSPSTFAKDEMEFDRAKLAAIRRLDELKTLVMKVEKNDFLFAYGIRDFTKEPGHE